MAVTEYVEVLKHGVPAWNAWREMNPVEMSEPIDNQLIRGMALSDKIRSQAEQPCRIKRLDLCGADLRGQLLPMANFCDVDLSGAALQKAYLSEADFSRASLRNANLSEAIVQQTIFSDTDLTEANLRGAEFYVGADLQRAKLEKAKLSGAFLKGANLRGADLTFADLRNVDLTEADLRETKLFGADITGANLSRALFDDADLTGIRWSRRRMRGRYLGIRGLDSCYGNALFKRDAADQDFLDTLEENWRYDPRWLLFWLWGLFDYGRSLGRVFVIATAIAALYGALYSRWPELLNHGESANTGFTPFYFSIVTYTTLGFGDVKPATLIGEIVVSTEVIVGYLTLGLLLAVLAEKVGRRS